MQAPSVDPASIEAVGPSQIEAPLTDDERRALMAYEATIRAGIPIVLQVGAALRAIRDSRLCGD